MKQHSRIRRGLPPQSARQQSLECSMRYLEAAHGLSYQDHHDLARALEARTDIYFTVVGGVWVHDGFAPHIVGGENYITEARTAPDGNTYNVDIDAKTWLERERSQAAQTAA